MIPLGDPVGTGLVTSLARPGGNVTGLTFMASGLAAKRLALLKEIVPRISRVLALSYLIDPIAAPQVKELESAAHSLGVKLRVRDIGTGDDLPAAFDAGARERAEGLLTTAESIFVVQRKRVARDTFMIVRQVCHACQRTEKRSSSRSPSRVDGPPRGRILTSCV
jgi:ABC-type uncharacterized transport system substrate-binding protein